MCRVSEELKLCSCGGEVSEADVVQLDNYWIYERLGNGEQTLYKIGEAVFHLDEIDRLNLPRLKQLLNERNCFDFELVPQEKDRLHLCFTFKEPPCKKYFEFKYEEGAWQFIGEMDWLEENLDGLNYATYRFGKIENPLA